MIHLAAGIDKGTYFRMVQIYDLPDLFEDRKAVWKAVGSITSPYRWNWDWDFSRQSDRMSCTVYGTKDKLADIEKRIRRLSRGKIRFQFDDGDG